MRVQRNRRTIASRAMAVICVALAAVIGLWQPASGAPAQAEITRIEAGYWTRALPFQEDNVDGQSTSTPVLFSNPAQVPGTTVPTLPTPQSPPTTAPTPVPFPTIPRPPVNTPDVPSGFPNPGVPAGGLWAANDSTGAYSVGAVRFQGDIGPARLTLFFASGSSPFGPVVVCPTLSNWKPEAGGAWNNRPAHDCDRLEISGKRNGAGNGVEFDLPSDLTKFGVQELSLMVLPVRSAGDVFSLQFEAPTAASLEIFGGQPLPETEQPTTTTTISGAPPTTQFVAPPTTSGSFTSGPGSTAPFSDGGIDQEISAPAPDTSQSPSTGVAGIGGDIIRSFTDDPLARFVSTGLLLAMGAAFFAFGGAEARTPQLLGGLATGSTAGAAAPVSTRVSPQPERGIGRFRRERNAKPGRL